MARGVTDGDNDGAELIDEGVEEHRNLADLILRDDVDFLGKIPRAAVDLLKRDGDAIQRVKTWATPPNTKRLKAKTPCASTGFCSNCNSAERICRVTTIIERKPRLTDLHVVVVNAELGF